MFKWYKSGIFEKATPQIRSSGIDLRLSGIVGIDVDIEKKSSHSNGSREANYRYIGGISSFQSVRIQS